jgi:hypothetical protein
MVFAGVLSACPPEVSHPHSSGTRSSGRFGLLPDRVLQTPARLRPRDRTWAAAFFRRLSGLHHVPEEPPEIVHVADVGRRSRWLWWPFTYLMGSSVVLVTTGQTADRLF